jgi:hypothetical protein
LYPSEGLERFGSVNFFEVFGSQELKLFIRKHLVKAGIRGLLSNKLRSMKIVTPKVKKLPIFFRIL